MIKLSSSISRKVPIQGIDFSSQSFSAGMEVEVADQADPELIKQRVRQLYVMLNECIDEQIAAASQPSRPAISSTNRLPRQTQPAQPAAKPNGNGNGGNGRAVPATAAQQKAVFAIAKSLNLDLVQVLNEWGVSKTEDLTVKQASALIDSLKSRQNGVRQ